MVSVLSARSLAILPHPSHPLHPTLILKKKSLTLNRKPFVWLCDAISNRDGWLSTLKLTRRPGRTATNLSQLAANVTKPFKSFQAQNVSSAVPIDLKKHNLSWIPEWPLKQVYPNPVETKHFKKGNDSERIVINWLKCVDYLLKLVHQLRWSA